MPVKTDQQIAPDNLLKIIRCNCKATSKSPCSTKLCSYRKHGLSCMQSCGECHGETCENREVINLIVEQEPYDALIKIILTRNPCLNCFQLSFRYAMTITRMLKTITVKMKKIEKYSIYLMKYKRIQT